MPKCDPSRQDCPTCETWQPAWVGNPTTKRWYAKMRPRLTGFPYLADLATRISGLPHLSYKHDQIKKRYYIGKIFTSPTWGSPPPWKQALELISHKLQTIISDTCWNIAKINLHLQKTNWTKWAESKDYASEFDAFPLIHFEATDKSWNHLQGVMTI